VHVDVLNYLKVCSEVIVTFEFWILFVIIYVDRTSADLPQGLCASATNSAFVVL